MASAAGLSKESFHILGDRSSSSNYGSGGLNPKPHAPGLNSPLLTAGIIVADVVGAGALSLPAAVAHFGWLGGSILLFLMLLMNVHVAIVMWRVFEACPGATTFSRLVALAFAGAPPAQRHFAVAFTGVMQVLTLICALSIYLLSVTKGLAMLRYDLEVCFPVWSIGACCVLLPVLVSMRKLGTWRWLIFANAGAMILALAIPLVVLGRDAMEGVPLSGRHIVAYKSSGSFGDACVGLCAMAFAFSSQFILVEIMAEMEDPSVFPWCYGAYSAPYQLLIFLAAGVGGYLCLGDRAQGMLLDYVPFGEALRTASLFMIINMVIAFCVKGVVLGRLVHRFVGGEAALTDDSFGAIRTWSSIAAAIVSFSCLVVQLVPFFLDLANLIGAVCVPVCCYMIPIAMYVRWLCDAGCESDMPGPLEKAVLSMEVVLCLLLMFVGTYHVVGRIGTEWHTFGFPFECHCEYLWKTCACSASRPGMELMCAFSLPEPSLF